MQENLIQKILDDLNHYKKNPKFIYTLENLEKEIYNENTFIRNFLINVDIDLNNSDEIKKKKINYILSKFIDFASKKYIRKISTADYDIYEYDTYYKWFIKNKKIDIRNSYETIFKSNEIISFSIDNHKRDFSNWNDGILKDIKNADKIEIRVKKI